MSEQCVFEGKRSLNWVLSQTICTETEPMEVCRAEAKNDYNTRQFKILSCQNMHYLCFTFFLKRHWRIF